MKFILRFLSIIVCLYILLVGVVSYVFHNVDHFHEEIQAVASNYLGQTVRIGEMETVWTGRYLGFYLGDITVEDRLEPEVKYAQVKHIAAKFKLQSLFLLWPKFSDFTIEQPKLTLESFSDGSFRFAGKRYQSSTGQQRMSLLLLSWLLNHKKADLHDGEFLWKHREGKQTLVEKFSAQYRHINGERSLYAVGQHNDDALGISANLTGNVIWGQQWDAHAMVLSGKNVNALLEKNVDVTVEQGQGRVHMQTFKAQRLADIVNIIGQGTPLQRWLSQSKMVGKLRDVTMEFSGSLTSLDHWKFAAKAQQISWQATEQVPGLDKLDADLVLDEHHGQLSLSSRASQFSWPNYFDQSYAVNQLEGKLLMRYQSDEIKVQFQDVNLDVPFFTAKKLGGQLIRTDHQAPFLQFGGRFATDNLQQLVQYFPRNTREQFRDWWANAMGGNVAVSGQAVFNGLLKKSDFQASRSRLEGRFKAKQPYLDYGFKRDWPIFTADSLDIELLNSNLRLTTSEADLGDIQLSNPVAEINELFSPTRQLKLQSELQGDLSELVDFLQDGPLISPEAKLARNPNRVDINSVQGRFTSELEVALPLRKIRDVAVSGKGRITDGQFMVGDLLEVANVNGDLNYSEKTVTGQNIQARIFGGETTLNVETLVPGAPPKVRISADGNASIGDMQRLISAPLASRFNGFSPWTGFIDIDQRGVQLAVNSELFGTQINFPAPLGKLTDTENPVSVSFQAGQDIETRLQLESSDFAIELQSAGRSNLLDRGLFSVGSVSEIEKSLAVGLPAEGINIAVAGTDLDLDAWLAVIQEMARVPAVQATSGTPFNERLRRIVAMPDSLVFFGKDLGTTNFNAESKNGLEWLVNVDGQYANGSGSLRPYDTIPSYEFVFDRLHWPSDKELLARGIVVPKKEEDSDVAAPNTYPDVDITARNFRAFDRDFSHLSFKARPSATAWRFDEILLEASGLELKGQGEWFDDQSRNGMTRIRFDIASGVGGQMLTDFGFGNFLKDGEIDMSTELYWRGAPVHFSLDRLNGTYTLDVAKGSFPKVDADSGRFLGLLNVNALSRRLRLDFGDVFGEGLVFDRMKTQGVLSNGDVILKDFYIFSPAIYIEALGKVGLAKENYDLRMLISPQLGGNVALLAALSNPAAGAVVWLVDRIFKNSLNKVIVYTYDVTGPWAEPVVSRVVKEADEDIPDPGN